MNNEKQNLAQVVHSLCATFPHAVTAGGSTFFLFKCGSVWPIELSSAGRFLGFL